MKRNKSSKTAFDLMRHHELKKFLEGIVQTCFFLWRREGVISLVIVLMMPAIETLKPPPIPPFLFILARVAQIGKYFT